MAAGAGDPLDEHDVGRVLEHRAVALLENVSEVLGGAPAGWVVLAHIAQAAGELGDPLAIAGLTSPLNREMGGLDELRTGDQSDPRGAEDFDRREIGRASCRERV